jgi:hypothetical protein
MRRLAAVLVLVVAAWAAWAWWRSDERRIAARWKGALVAFEKSGQEDQLTAFGKVRDIVSLFAPGFVISARPYEGTIADGQQLAAVVARYRDSARRIQVSDADREIALFENRTAEMTAVVQIDGERGSGPGRERFRVRAAWREDDGLWRIQELEIVEVLEDRGLLF